MSSDTVSSSKINVRLKSSKELKKKKERKISAGERCLAILNLVKMAVTEMEEAQQTKAQETRGQHQGIKSVGKKILKTAREKRYF